MYNVTYIKKANLNPRNSYFIGCSNLFVFSGGVFHMDVLITFLVAVAAGVVSHLICKWMDGGK